MAKECVIPPGLDRAEPIGNGRVVHHTLSLHHIMIVVAGVCTFSTLVLSVFLSGRHMTRFSHPEQQKYLVRIAILPAIVGLFHLFGVIFYNSSRFLESFPTLFEAVAICAVFELCVTYISLGVPDNAAARFRHAARTGRYGQKSSGPTILRINFILLYQLPFVILACLIATEVTSALQCELSSAYKSSQKTIRLISAASTIIALIQLIIFHIFMRQELRGLKTRRKLVGIKILAGFVIIVTVVFGFLKPSMTQRFTHASYFDITVGIPNLLTCIAMMLFAAVWLYLFGLPAVVQNEPDATRVPVSKALLEVFNISDLLMNPLAALTTDFDEQKGNSVSSSEIVTDGFKNEVGAVQ